MHARHTIAAATAVLGLTLVGCSSSVETETESKPKTTPKAKPPAYSVIKETNRLAELLVEGATKSSATAAIEDWIDTSVGDRKSITVQVVRTKGAGTIVCRGKYYADEDIANIQTGGRIKADNWPHTEIDCPDPGGS